MDSLKSSLSALVRSRPGLLAGGAVLLALSGLALLTLLGGPAPQPSPSPSATPAAVVTPSPSAPPTLPPTPSAEPSVDPSPSPTPLSPYAPLDGMPAPPELAHRLPMAVMIDNNARARPQAGFNRASIVYHAPNDGGTNRYMLVFQEMDAELIGPVRSTRLFFNGWVFEYRAAFAHYGGDWKSVKRLREIDGELVYDIDALRGSARPYWRDRTRRAPFNAYTDSQRLWDQAERNGAPAQMVAGLPLRPFDEDLPAAERPTSGSLRLPYRGYAVSYDYDHETNSYRRSIRGEPHRDALDNSRVTARNVIVQFVDVFYDRNQRYNRAVMEYVGRGRAIVFRDGLAIEGTWRKESEKGLTVFLDGDGNEISLVRGPIYIQVIADTARVTYEVGSLP